MDAGHAGRRALMISLIGLVITASICPAFWPRIAVDIDLVDTATAALTSACGITRVRDLRTRWTEHTLRAEADLIVDSEPTVGQAHDLAHHAETHLLADVPRVSAATIYVSPANSHPQPAVPARS